MESTAMSAGAQVIIALIPIVGIAIGGILVFFALLWHHRENKLRIKAGTFTAKKFNVQVFSLLAGLLLIGVGLVLTVMFAILEGLSFDLLGGLIPLIIGIMLVVFYKVNPNYRKNSDLDEE
ncbi:MAG: hypothetical protein WCQ67_04170 [Treponema sp.]